MDKDKKQKGGDQTANPLLRQSLDLGPTIVFFALYSYLGDGQYTFWGHEYSGLIWAGLALVPLLLLSMAILWWLSGKLSRIQIFTLFMTVFFGALTAWFNDERFFKAKTSIVYGSFAISLWVGLMMKKSWMQYIIGEFLPMRDEGWMILTRRLVWMFAALAIANEVIWRTMSTATWVKLETFGMPIVLFLFLWAQIFTLRPYLIEDKKT